MAKKKDTKSFLVNASVRHAVYINRFSTSQVKEMLPVLQRIRRGTAGALSDVDITSASKKRLDRLYDEITGINAAAMESMGKKLKSNMRDLAEHERDFNERMLVTGTKVDWDVPDLKQVTAAVFSDPVLEIGNKGLNVDDILDDFSEKKGKQIIGAIKDGVITGKSNSEILRGLSLVVDTSMSSGLKAVIRTVTKHVSETARDEFYRENRDVILGVEWIATLDASTCIVCASLDHTIYETGTPVPSDPHFGCRCVKVPVVKPEFSIAGAVGGLERPARGPGDKPQHGISADTTYSDWLRDQPAWFQDDILGIQKGAIFREGGLDIKRFVDDDRKGLTLEKLKNADGRSVVGKAVMRSGILDDDE